MSEATTQLLDHAWASAEAIFGAAQLGDLAGLGVASHRLRSAAVDLQRSIEQVAQVLLDEEEVVAA